MTRSSPAIPAIELDDLARRLNATFPELDEEGRVVALATYRALAHGEPVPDYGIAATAGMDIMHVQDVMRPWPGVYRNESGRIIGFWGLTIQQVETAHPMDVDGVELYAWCAWDTLFLPGILGSHATVRSSSAVTGDVIRVEVSESSVVADPVTTALSFLDPRRGDIDPERIISSFCRHVLFFSTVDEGIAWVERSDREADAPAPVLSVKDAFELGRAFNRTRFGLD